MQSNCPDDLVSKLRCEAFAFDNHWMGSEAKLLRQAADELERRAWQPIETAPKDGRMFICWVRAVRYSDSDNAGDPPYEHDASEPDFCMWKPNDGNGYWDNMTGTIGDAQDVTHWMPIPEAPKHV